MQDNITLELVDRVEDYESRLDEFSYSGEGYVVRNNGEFIGLIKGDESLEYEATCFIDEIRIAEEHRGKGYGRQALSLLKDELDVTRFEGVSVPEARGFWLKMGAKFYDRCEICAFNDDCKDRKNKESREACGEYDKNYFITE